MKTFDQLCVANKIVPVVVIDNMSAAIPLAHSLIESGIKNIEVTMRTPNALAIIQKIAKEVPEITVGAGTIKNAGDFLNAYNAGAKFIISPGCTNELFVAARSHRNVVKYIPGIVTPSEAMYALGEGYNTMKFFPAESYNGLSVLKALRSPLPELKFCPTGGITIHNMANYLNLPNVIAVGMSSIVEAKLIDEGDFVEIKRRCTEAVFIANNLSNN